MFCADASETGTAMGQKMKRATAANMLVCSDDVDNGQMKSKAKIRNIRRASQEEYAAVNFGPPTM